MTITEVAKLITKPTPGSSMSYLQSLGYKITKQVTPQKD